MYVYIYDYIYIYVIQYNIRQSRIWVHRDGQRWTCFVLHNTSMFSDKI